MICIPARGEEALLPALLHALSSLRTDGRRVAFCFYLDGDDGRSAAVLHAAGARLPGELHVVTGVRRAEPNAGRARHDAMALGLRVLDGGEGLLFSTDADSLPAADWIVRGAAALAQADVATGRIVRLDGGRDRQQTRIEEYYDRLYAYRRRLDPVAWEAEATHHYAGGANMAIRAAVYRALGGFRPLPFAEDATLIDDAARAGYRVRRDAALVVATSSRRDGRAVHGLASALRSLDDGRGQWVAHPDGVAWQARAHALARRTFAAATDAAACAALGGMIGLSGDHVRGVARDCPNAEAFAMRIVPAAPTAGQMVTIEHAEAALRALEIDGCEVAA
jgi:hypothetical protein